jgi:hypothetical protein
MGLLGRTVSNLGRKARRSGRFGDRRTWVVLGGVVSVVRWMRRRTRRADGVVVSETIRPGETLVIEAARPQRRKRRERG